MPREKLSSPQICAVLTCFVVADRDWLHGYLLQKATGLKGGTVYPMLRRLKRAAILEARREETDLYPTRVSYRLLTPGLRLQEKLRRRYSVAVNREILNTDDDEVEHLGGGVLAPVSTFRSDVEPP